MNHGKISMIAEIDSIIKEYELQTLSSEIIDIRKTIKEKMV